MFVDYRELNHDWYFYDICTCLVVVGAKYSGCDDGNITSYPENVLRVNTGKTSWAELNSGAKSHVTSGDY